jgi:hypothetical protein
MVRSGRGVLNQGLARRPPITTDIEHRTALFAAGLIDLIEYAAIREMRRLRLMPIAEFFVDGEEFQLRELRAVFGGDDG